jgi:hypothetical protein
MCYYWNVDNDLENLFKVKRGKVLVFATPYAKQAQSEFISKAKNFLTRSTTLTPEKSILEITKGTKNLTGSNFNNTYETALEAYLLKANQRNTGVTPFVIMIPEINKSISVLNKALASFVEKDYQAKVVLVICTEQDALDFKFKFDRVNLTDYLEGYLEDLCKRNPLVRLITNSTEIVGMNGLTTWLKRRAVCFDNNTGIKLKGISVFGVPGTGKTMSAFKCAEILNCPVYLFDVHSALDSFQGNSEKAIDQALRYIATIGRAVILIDEVDKMFSSTLSDHSGTTQRILKKLLDFMQSNGTLFFVLTGNSISSVPPELIRRGRLNEYFYADLPTEDSIALFIKSKAGKYISVPSEFYANVFNSEVTAKLKSLNYGLTDVEFLLEECVLDFLNGEEVKIEDHMKNIIPSFKRNEETYLATRIWSENNARNIN